MAVQPLYEQQIYPLRQGRLDGIMNRAGAITLEYWALTITVLLGIIVLAALSVPFLTYLGLYSIAKPIFYSLHLICAQIPAHSFYILGHQLGMGARNMGIYGSMFVGGLVFVLSKKRLWGIPWWIWILMILPMAYDGLTQMFGLRESTWELRLLTGALFGIGNMWFVLPFIQKTVNEMMASATPAPMLATQQFAAHALPVQTIQQFVPIQTPAPANLSVAETPLPLANNTAPLSLFAETSDEVDASQTEEAAPIESTVTEE